MSGSSLRKPSYADSKTRSALFNLENDPRRGGRLITGVVLSTTAYDLSHGLGRRYKGYDIVKRSAAAHVYDSESDDDTRFLRLTASSAVTVSIYVF